LRSRTRRSAPILALVLTLALLGAACGDDDTSTTDTGAGGGDGGGDEFSCPEGSALVADGTINISGSSTVAPITQQAADCFAEAGGTGDITVDNPGTGDGFKLFCAGETDISDASRAIKPEGEADVCAQNGVEFIELKIGFDGMAVMTSPANDTVECLSFEDLYAIMGPESQGKTNWKDASTLAAELGSDTEFPDLDLEITAPGEESGTYDSFIEIALAKIEAARLEAGKITEDQNGTTRPDYSSQANDDAIIQGIEGADGSFGWVGFAFADQAGDGVKILDVAKAAGGDCVSPSADTIADGSYPLSRSLYIYVNAEKADSNEAVASFVDYYIANMADIVEEADYVALPDDQASDTASTWEDRTTGSAA